MPDRFSDAELDAAVERLTEPGRLEAAQNAIVHVAPQLQRILAEALESGGWFSSAHQAEVRRVCAIEDADERNAAVRTLIAEETRVSMFVGAAVGLELARLLNEGETTDG